MPRPIIVPVGKIAVSTWLLTIRQRLGMYVFQSLPGKNWEMNFFWLFLYASHWVMFLWLVRTVSLLHFCGIPECKPHWLLEPGDLETYSLGGCHKSCGVKHAVQAPSREILVIWFYWSGLEGESPRDVLGLPWSLGKITTILWMPARLEALPKGSSF